jgi:hypothetical protein
VDERELEQGVPAPPYDDAVSYPSLDGSQAVQVESAEDFPEDRQPEALRNEQLWMSDDSLLSVVQREVDSALGWTGTRLAERRRYALQQYFGNPRGDEREGRSQVVTRDVFEQVEWLLPSLMEIFTSGPQVVRFVPKNDDDVQSAEQATAVVNHVFSRENGFMVLYTMFKDALVQKNGIVKVWFENSTQVTFEDYEGKNLIELQAVTDDEDYEMRKVTAWHINQQTGEREELNEDSPLPENHDPMRVRYDIEGVRYKRSGKIALENVAPEEFIINRDARGLDDPTCRFVGQRIRTSESQLIAWGHDPELVRRIPSSQSVYSTDQDSIIRASQDDSFPLVFSDRKDSERTVYVTESHVLVDRDGDGVSEWWKVVTGGDYAQSLLHAEPANGHPFVSVTPIPVPHRFHGLSLADVTGDLQEINTTLWRQFLNCAYLATDPRNIVLSRGVGEAAAPMVNLNQLLNAAPGGYIEEYEPGALRPYEQKSNASEILPALEVHSKMKETRTGISPEAMGINPDSISKHVYGTMVQSSAAATRTTLYARIFADTGVKNLFEKIYMLLMQHDTRGMTIRLRGEYVHVDPTSWATEVDCQVTVGLGHGSKMEKSMNLQTIGEVQKALHEAGLPQMASATNVFNTVSDLVESLGFRSPEQYFTDPSTVEPPEPPPDLAQIAVEKAQEIEFMRVELKRQEVELKRDELMLEIKKTELDHEVKIQELRAAGYAAEADMAWRIPPPGQPTKAPAEPTPIPPPPGGSAPMT